MENIPGYQDYNSYTAEDHQTWSLLMNRLTSIGEEGISNEYLAGLKKLDLDQTRIIRIDEISRRLEAISGWTLVPVSGLIPTKDFFYMLINKRYPVTTFIRKPWEIDFSEQPDIFHDVCGHLPLLTNEKFVKFLTAYSIIALKYVNYERAIDFLGRLYWFTYEMGLIREGRGCKPYGGAIITSATEQLNRQQDKVPKYAFDLDHIFRTPYDSFKLQKEYFVIESFDQLFNSVGDIESRLIEHLLLPTANPTISEYPLNAHLGREFNNVIGFLNDIQYKFPEAISFAAGQPDEKFFDIEEHLGKFNVYVDHLIRQTGVSRQNIIRRIGQYSKTKGIINDIIAEYLKNDEDINLSPDDILITTGAQEAFGIIVATICNRDRDVVLVENPGYIGLSSFAKIFAYNTEAVRIDDEGIELVSLEERIIEISRSGKKMKLLYVIPDYQNPSGSCMPVGNRLKLLELSQKYNFLIIEDAVYNSFTYAQKKTPTIKSLDRNNRVIYVGSFSKSIFPGLRIGLIAAGQMVSKEDGNISPLVDEMAKVKAQITNNTSAVSQAILGGILLSQGCSLNELNKRKLESYKEKRNMIITSLHKYIKAFDKEWSGDIRFNEPDGGFFIKMSLPFPVDIDDVHDCAERFNVIFTPMRYFYLSEGGNNEIRLTFSNLSLPGIDLGISKLAAYLKERCMSADVALAAEIEASPINN